MDIADLKRVNRLWEKIYPFLASQILEHYPQDSGSVLELGPFSGGISRELKRRCPRLDIIIADESAAVLESFREFLSIPGPCENIAVQQTKLNPLVFPDDRFDLVIVRGAFFFLDEKGDLLREVFRVLKPGGTGFAGGGFGKNTPQALIDEIAGESRRLNDRLGRKRVGIEELAEIVKRSGLSASCEIVAEGGLWLYVRK